MERRSSSTRLFQGERVSKNLSLHVFITSVFVFFWWGGVGGGGERNQQQAVMDKTWQILSGGN